MRLSVKSLSVNARLGLIVGVAFAGMLLNIAIQMTQLSDDMMAARLECAGRRKSPPEAD